MAAPWIAVAGLFLAGYYLATPAVLSQIGAENSRSGPPFYDCASNQPMRLIPTAYNAKWRAAAPGTGTMKVGAKQSAEISTFLRKASEDARLYQWKKATDRSDRIIIQPNQRKPTYVRSS